MTKIAERAVLITGGNGALGFEAARAIAARDDGWTIVLAGRDATKAGAAATTLTNETGARVLSTPLDLASLESVRRCTDTFATIDIPPLSALVCNAGVQIVHGISRSADGHESTFAVNHLAHFLLANRLAPSMTAGARIVFVASDTHDPKRRTGMPAPRYTSGRALALPDDVEDTVTAGRRRYTTSKLCNVFTAYEMSRRLGADSTICVNAFDPGLMPGTGLARDYGRVQKFAWRYLLPAATVLPLNINSRKTSGAALAALAVDPRFDGVTGRYFEGVKDSTSSVESYDTAKAAELWDSSAELVGL